MRGRREEGGAVLRIYFLSDRRYMGVSENNSRAFYI